MREGKKAKHELSSQQRPQIEIESLEPGLWPTLISSIFNSPLPTTNPLIQIIPSSSSSWEMDALIQQNAYDGALIQQSPHFCTGEVDGKQCRCRRYIHKPDCIEEKCTCNHPEGYHPLPALPAPPAPLNSGAGASAASIVAAYQMPNQVMKSTRPSASQPSAPQPIASSSKPSTSVTAALQETNSGLRRTTDVSEQWARKKQRTTSACKDKEDKHVIRMGQVILIICKAVGRDPETGVNIWRNPDDAEITMKEGQGLAINGLRDLLSFSTNWEDDEMDGWFRQLFPDFFKWVDSVDPLNPYANPPTYHWQLMIRRGNQLKVSPNQLRDGKETNRYLGSSVHGKTDLRRIYLRLLVSSHRVPKSIYQNGWVNAGLSKPSSPKSDSDRYSTCEESEHESWDESGKDTDAGRKQRSKVAQGKRKAEDISSKNTQHKRDARGEIKPQPQPQSLSRALSVISITDTDEFPATLAPFIPFTDTPTIASTPLSHQSLEVPSTSTHSPPSSRTRFSTSNFSVYSTFTSDAFLRLNDSDLEVDPFFWTRPNDDT
ncbi:hypothetical protein C8R44DRAFT_856166 [Mycena epipterygia]|nr:hypothetical protein C8R44DRAFT_856166 [Mycena epipterygia]